MSSLYYNHPFWPSPRAARIAKLFLNHYKMPRGMGRTFEQTWREYWVGQGRPVKPEGRLTHDKALKVMADYLGLSVHEFLHIKPVDAILRLKLAYTEAQAWSILGNTTLPVWWWGGRMPCCVVCDRMLPPVPAAHVPWQAATPLATAAPAEPPAAATVVPVRDPPSGPLPPLSPALPDRLHPPPGYVLWSESDDPCSCRALGRTCNCFPVMHDGSGRLWFVTGPGEVWRATSAT